MPRRANAPRPALPAAEIEAALAIIARANEDTLTGWWRRLNGTPPPSSLPRGFLRRLVAHQLQIARFGDLDRASRHALEQAAAGKIEAPRRIKPGSVLVREHRGVLHEVVVLPQGYLWRGATYDSLSVIAKAITGVTWNGPRFFGLRQGKAERVRRRRDADIRSLSLVASS